jgi:hypothetical protein
MDSPLLTKVEPFRRSGILVAVVRGQRVVKGGGSREDTDNPKSRPLRRNSESALRRAQPTTWEEVNNHVDVNHSRTGSNCGFRDRPQSVLHGGGIATVVAPVAQRPADSEP